VERQDVDIRQTFVPDMLAGQVAVVTGGGSGIGYAIARDLAACGADVVITSRSADRLAKAELSLAEETGRLCGSFPCDIREDAEVDRLRDYVLQRHGPATIVVNNAAANFQVRAERMTRRALESVVDTDLIGSFMVTRAFVPEMIKARSGVILSVTIPYPELGFPRYAHCGAAKAAIVSLTSSWAHEWGPYGIRVNAIGPGPVPTEGVAANMLRGENQNEGPTWEKSLPGIPLGRLGRPSDISAAAVYLCSPAASWVTGVHLVVDGGTYLTPSPADSA
jgi:NAD(P)-dependent dehydrogenase (short-subunit alcohol dehydrogenase family)